MEKKGYKLIKGFFSGIFDPTEILDNNDWKYSASFVKSDMM